jgi:hypothetical protein
MSRPASVRLVAHPLPDLIGFLQRSDCPLPPATCWRLVAIVDRMQQQPDGTFACDLTDAELATVLRVGSERQVRRLLSPRAEPVERLWGPYPRLVTWHRRVLALDGVDAPVHHQPRTFVWHGVTRTADEIAAESAEPARLVNLADAALLAQQQQEQSEPEGYAEMREACIGDLRRDPDPEDVLRQWERVGRMVPIVARLRADADVQAILERAKPKPVLASALDALPDLTRY